jgi:uncharacterized SAM-binding protein YcdF (DUF218 family)
VNRSFRKTLFWLGYLCLTLGVVVMINGVDIALHTCAPVSRADAALVLGSTVRGGEPSPVFQARLTTAADLFQKGVVSRLVVSGASTSDGEVSEAESGATFLQLLGVPADRIVQEREARSTRDNLAFGGEVLRLSGARTWIVVSDRFHLRRAELLARELGIPFACVSAPDRGASEFPFLASEARKVLYMRIMWLIRWVAGDAIPQRSDAPLNTAG